MQVYRIVADNPEVCRFYTGATESSKVARDISREGGVTQVYEFTTPKIAVDKESFIKALNQDAWCEPKLVAQFENGRKMLSCPV
jgi:hypothetical protein